MKLKEFSDILEEDYLNLNNRELCQYLDNYWFNEIEHGLTDVLFKFDKLGAKSPSDLLGRLYLHGEVGLEKDINKGIYWLSKSFFKFGNIKSGYSLASIYDSQKQYKQAYQIYQTIATINHHVALTALGGYHELGFYVDKDFNKALDYYQQAEQQGNLTAPMLTARIYRKQGKYLKSLTLAIKTIGQRLKALIKNQDEALERFRIR